ncbi:MAG TPA: large conductance mechanosensitive channel protein MscL [Thiobacillaceae bacterium]|nr:large conductance mechanosensitive channel protein MscL [Thiobacillaceae bacterium]HNU63841.1 large conductance mechanosensitive channel protein MscL [Thiobacillaceae bacterium]
MSFLQEFKEFAMRGNVVDMAVGVVIGTAFGKIVASLVGDVITPLLGALLGEVDFKHLYVALSTQTFASLEEAEKAGVPLIKYGAFIQSILDFVLIAFAIFLAIKAINRLKHQEESVPAETPATPEDIVLLREIRDTLKR